jgi:hypothetical protein
MSVKQQQNRANLRLVRRRPVGDEMGRFAFSAQ